MIYFFLCFLFGKSDSAKRLRQDYEKKRLLDNLETDTGFNIICCSCNEYKSRQLCVNIIQRGSNQSRFSPEQESEFLLKDNEYNLSIDGHFYICFTCKNQIQSKKKPKRNDRDFLQYYDFPEELFQEVKQYCSPVELFYGDFKKTKTALKNLRNFWEI